MQRLESIPRRVWRAARPVVAFGEDGSPRTVGRLERRAPSRRVSERTVRRGGARRSGSGEAGAGRAGDLAAAAAFTLIELLTVIAIIGLLAGLSTPVLKNFRKGDATVSSTRQLMDAVARARQLAVSQRTTVYLVFVPMNFWNDPAYASNTKLSLADRVAATNLAEKQLVAYNFVALRSVGDQPGRSNPRYLSTWQTLPDGTFISQDKFNLGRGQLLANLEVISGFRVYGFDVSTNIPFPLAETLPCMVTYPRRYAGLPYLAFNYLGQLTTEGLSPECSRQDEFVPLAHGGVMIARDAKRVPVLGPAATSAAVTESPVGNSTNSYNLVHVDALTGRARIERQEIK
jgi:prepilin-type N-terminal cleavage/methylation domain-containing protein